MTPPKDKLLTDERGIDLAIMAYFGSRMAGGSSEEAARGAKAMLDIFSVPRSRSQTIGEG